MQKPSMQLPLRHDPDGHLSRHNGGVIEVHCWQSEVAPHAMLHSHRVAWGYSTH
jgi:hypothetical protein